MINWHRDEYRKNPQGFIRALRKEVERVEAYLEFCEKAALKIKGGQNEN
jgi:hypothetical protein